MYFSTRHMSHPAAAKPSAGTADLTIVGGAGHVGVPLVLSFAAKGLSVNVNDRNEEALKVLQSGRLPFIEIGANELLTKALAEKKLTFTSRPNEISTKGPVIVTIGTPVDEFLNPVRRVIQDCLDEIVPHLKDGRNGVNPSDRMRRAGLAAASAAPGPVVCHLQPVRRKMHRAKGYGRPP